MESGQALDAASNLLQSGDAELAAITYGHAVRWYSPGSGPVAHAVDALETLAREQEASGDALRALRTWRTLRSALFAIRHVYWPFEDRLTGANQRILALSTTGLPPEEVERHAALLARDPSPDTFWALVATIGFAVWVAVLFGLARRLVGDDGRFAWRAAAPWAAAFAATAGIWIAGLAFA